MKKRVFLAFPLKEPLISFLSKIQKKFKNEGLKFVKKENLHITLFFFGYLEKKEIEKLLEILQKNIPSFPQFFVFLNEILTFPEKRPRMIWAKGEAEEILFDLRKKLAQEFKKEKIPFDEKHFLLHICLARKKGKSIGFKVRKRISISFKVEKLTFFESVLKRGGPFYKEISSFPLKELKV